MTEQEKIEALKMTWFKRIISFFRKHDFEYSEYRPESPLIAKRAVCKKCGKEDVYLPFININPAIAREFYYGCPGKKSNESKNM